MQDWFWNWLCKDSLSIVRKISGEPVSVASLVSRVFLRNLRSPANIQLIICQDPILREWFLELMRQGTVFKFSLQVGRKIYM